jgi:hypothetical protein
MTHKWIISLFCIACVVTLAFSVPQTHVAEGKDNPANGASADNDPGNGCKLQGTWIIGGYPGPTMLATYNGTGDNQGTEDIEIVVPAVPVEPGIKATSIRGVWAKSGPNSYDYRMQGYALLPDNTVYYVFLTKGTKILTSCNTMEATATTDFYWPGAEVPFLSVSGPMTGRRLLVDQAAPIQ